MWNLKNKINEPTKQKEALIHITDGQLSEGRGVGGLGKWGRDHPKNIYA